MGPVICAIGRAENHELLRSHAQALGIGYVALDSEDSGLIVNGARSLHQFIEAQIPHFDRHRLPILTTIDSSLRQETVRSLIATSQSAYQLPLSLQGNLELLETFESPKDQGGFDSRFAITVARSPHGQIALWPVLEISGEGAVTLVDPMSKSSGLDLLLQTVQGFVAEKRLVGVLTFLASHQGQILHRQWGLTSLWDGYATHTTVAEQLLRALVDLPLGATEVITDSQFYLEEVVDLNEHAQATSQRLGIARRNLAELLIDPTRAFLHLFARNPKLKVNYLSDSRNLVKIVVYAESQDQARIELDHAKDFMAGFDL